MKKTKLRKIRKKLALVKVSLKSSKKWNKKSVPFLKSTKKELEIEIAKY